MIAVKTFIFNPFQENTYVVHDDSQQCLIIDPGCHSLAEQEAITRFIADQQLTPIALINTHCHIDHILGVDYLKQHYSIPFRAHEAEKPLLLHASQQALFYGLDYEGSPEPDGFLKEGDTVEAGTARFVILHIPGHSPGSVALYSEAEKKAFVGDVLFQGSIGRTDLPGGDYETLISGIKEKLMILDPDTVVYSGHGPQTTIGHESNTNPFLN
jgi:hydroxyacylglutathione hydrolase